MTALAKHSADTLKLVEILKQFAEREFQQIVEDRIPRSNLPCRVTTADIEEILLAAIRADVALGVRGETIHCFRDQSDPAIAFGCPLTDPVRQAFLSVSLDNFFGTIERKSTVANTDFDEIAVLDEFRYNDQLAKAINRERLLQDCTAYISECLLESGSDLQLLAAAIAQLPVHLHHAQPVHKKHLKQAIGLAKWWTDDFSPAMSDLRSG